MINYTSKTREEILAEISANIDNIVPELAGKFIPNTFWYNIISIWAFFIEYFSVYLDKYAQNTFIGTTDTYSAAVNIAYAHDYRVHGRLSSSGYVTLTLSSQTSQNLAGFVIPSGTRLTSSQLIFTTVKDVVIPAATNISNYSVSFEVVQDDFVSDYVFGQVSNNSEYLLPESVKNNSLAIKTVAPNGNITLWGRVNSFANSMWDSFVFQQDVNTDGVPIFRFGDGIQGSKPTYGDVIMVSYIATAGSGGNVSKLSIVDFESALTLGNGWQYRVTNFSNFNGGKDVEDLASIKARVPLHNNTATVCNTPQNFIDSLKRNPYVANAVIDTTSNNCGSTITLFTAGYGNNNPITQSILNSVAASVADRLLYNTTMVLKPVGIMQLLIKVNIRSNPNYYNTQTQAEVFNSLDTYLFNKALIGGTLFYSDIYQVIEGCQSVDNSNIVSIDLIPTPTATGTTQNQIVCNITYLQYEEAEYRITFISSTTFYLHKNNNYVGTYSTFTIVNTGFIEFNVVSNHSINDSYVFNTYNNTFINGVIQIKDFNIIALSANSLITATGGL